MGDQTINPSHFLEDTLDIRQKTRRVTKEELFVWRFCLIKRFQSYSTLGATLIIQNFDFNDQILGLFNTQSTDSKEKLPYNLSKTVLRLKDTNSTPERQLLVVSLYIKKPTDTQGTILVQGNTCSFFGVNEFNSLQDLVKSTPKADEDQLVNLYLKLESIPLNDFYEQVSPEKNPEFSTNSNLEVTIDPSTEIKSYHRDSRRMSHRFLSSSQIQQPDHLQKHKEDEEKQSAEEIDLEEMINRTTSQKLEEIYPTIQQEMRKQLTLFQLQLKNEQKAVLSNLEQENEDLKASIKFFKAETQRQSSLLGDIRKHLQKLEKQINDLNQENHYLKITVDKQTKHIDSCKSEILQLKQNNEACTSYADVTKSTPISHQTETPANPTTSIQNQQYVGQTIQGQSLQEQSTSIPQYSVTTSNKFNALSELIERESKGIEHSQNFTPPRQIPVQVSNVQRTPKHLSDLDLNVGKDPSGQINVEMFSNQCCLPELKGNQDVRQPHIPVSHSLSSLHQIPVIGSQHTSQSQIPMFDNQCGLANTNIRQNLYSNEIPVSQSLPDKVESQEQKKRPIDSLYQTLINDQTDYLIIGDSCLHKLNSAKMNTGHFKYTQKICISGIKISEIIMWIQTLSIYPNVRKLVVHAGVNDIDHGIVSKESWSYLIAMLQTKFPYSHISMSSIIPFKSNKQVNITIHQSNANLHHSCSIRSVLFINHTSTFRTANDSPKQALYQENNQKHPSIKGVLLLARNIKYPGVDFRKIYEENQRNKNRETNEDTLSNNTAIKENIQSSQYQEQYYHQMHRSQAQHSANVPQNSLKTDINNLALFNDGNTDGQVLHGQNVNKSDIISKMNILLHKLIS